MVDLSIAMLVYQRVNIQNIWKTSGFPRKTISFGSRSSKVGSKWAAMVPQISSFFILYTLWLFNIAMGNGTFIEVYLLNMVIFHCYVKQPDGTPFERELE